jgi:hypothetical protein
MDVFSINFNFFYTILFIEKNKDLYLKILLTFASLMFIGFDKTLTTLPHDGIIFHTIGMLQQVYKHLISIF